MTDTTTTAANQIAGFGTEPSSGDIAQPKHDPNLTEVEADDGFDEEYEFVAPATRPAQPSIDPDAGNEELANETDWELPIDQPNGDSETSEASTALDPGSDRGTVMADDAPEGQALMELAGKPASRPVLVVPPATPTPTGVSSATSREAVSLSAVSLWQHAVVDRAHVASIEIEQRAAEIEEDRHGRLPQGRALPDGRYEIADGALTLFAHELIAAQGGPDQIMIEVAPLTDVEMFRIAHREGRADTSVLAYDRARSIQAALDLFGGTQKQIAETLGLDEATVTNSLHILKVEKQMGPVLSDPWRITENQAKRFQKLWSDPARRPLVRKAVKELEVGTARAHMSALFKAFPTASKNETPIVNAANVQIGTIRRSTAGITIKLEKLADAVPADDLGAILADAIGASHR